MKIIKDVNFIPNYKKEKNFNIKKKISSLILIFIGLAIIVLVFATPKLIYKYEQSRQKAVTEQLKSLSDVSKKVDTLKEIIDNKKKKEDALKDIESKQIKVVDLFNKINNAIPQNVSLKAFALSERQLNVAFSLNSPTDLVALIKSLEGLGIFEKVDISTFLIVDANQTVSFSLNIK